MSGCLPSGPVGDGTVVGDDAGTTDAASSSKDAAAGTEDLGTVNPTPDLAMAAAPDMAKLESLTVTFTTSAPPTGAYAPKNVVAVWIENNGTFVKTIGRWANTRKEYLLGWVGKAGANDMDAVSSATQAAYGSLTANWNLGAQAGDGIYTIRLELASGDSTATTQNNEGTFTFNRNGTASTQTALTNGGFSKVSITYSGR
ncbi:MAG: DUF2271 domain-containing protein [Polyangia bacterium]